MGADNAFISCGLRILVDQAAKPGASPDADFVVGRRQVSLSSGGCWWRVLCGRFSGGANQGAQDVFPDLPGQ